MRMWVGAALAGALLMAAPAEAAVRYSGTDGGFFSFDFVSPTFITSATGLTAAEANCQSSIAPILNCTALFIDPANNLSDDLTYVVRDFANNPGGTINQFADGSFAAYGNYIGSNGGTLSVSAVSGAPEPGTWAMMIFGFGLAGSALRRRQRHAGISTRVVFA